MRMTNFCLLTGLAILCENEHRHDLDSRLIPLFCVCVLHSPFSLVR